jgi:cytochrome bd-type quinol oxidase subunit 1
MSLLIKLSLGVANGLVWAFILACLFRPQLWMALGPILGSVLALKGATP